MKNSFKLAAFAIAMIFAAPTFAYNKAGTIPLTLGGGYDSFSGKRRVDNSGVGFAALGYNFTDNWGIEGLVGLFNTRSNYPATYDQNVKGSMYAVNAVYHFGPYRSCEPYVLAGPGVMGFNPSGTDANYEGNLNAAVGADVFFTEKVALRAEVRDFYTFTGGKNDVFVSGGVVFLFNT
jgi:OmpA-OmpF porin, OOP family